MRSRVVAYACLACLVASAAAASPREESISVMDSVQWGWSDLGLRAWVNEDDDQPLRLGEPIQYHFEADQECFLTVVHIDAHGVATVLSPNEFASENRLEPGKPRAFPCTPWRREPRSRIST